MIKLLDLSEFSDVCFVVHGIEFYAHKYILTARSKYFEDAFVCKWEQKSIVHINHKDVNPYTFRAILNYLYIGQHETQVNQVDDVVRLAGQCKLKTLSESLEQMISKAYFFQSTKPGTHMTTVLVESPPDSCELQMDLAVLAEEALPIKLRHWLAGPELLGYQSRDWYGNVIFLVEDNQLLCHTVEVNSVDDVLMAADICLLSGLKCQCGVFISNCLNCANVMLIGAMRTARMFDLPRLEDQCCQFIAESLEMMLHNPNLHELILEDAAQVNQREDVDSIDVIDNVRKGS